MEKVDVYFSIVNGGDGSAYPTWFLTGIEADEHQENMDEGWGEPCIGLVETYVGSNIHKVAMENSK